MQKENGFIISTTLYALFGVMLLVIFYILYFLFSNKIVNNYSSKKLKEDVNITSVTNDNTTLSGIVLSKALNDDPNIRQFKKYNITEYYYQNYPFDNYVWYSGKLWRITKINSDGTVRLITEDSVYLSSFGVDFDKFYNTLRNPDFYLAKFKQCNDYISTANFDTLTDVYKDSNCPFTTYYPGYFNKNFQNNELWKCKNISSEYISVLELKEVLNAGYSNSCGNCSIVNEWSNECSEYGDNIDQSSCEMCEKNANKEYYINNYLINSTDFWTSTYQAIDVRQYKDIYNDYSWHITSNGKVKYSKLFGNNIKDGSCWSSETIQSIKSVRPVINIKQNILVTNGDGTKNNPYRLESDYDTDVSGQKISDRYSGEYIKYSGYLWRISENGNYKYKDDTGLIQNISGTKIIIEDQILYSSANSYYGNITPVNMDNYILPNLNNYNNYLLTNVEWEARGASINSSATLEYSTLGIVHFRDLFAGSEINNIRQDYYLNDYVSDECDTRGAIRVDGTVSNSTWSVDPDNTRDIRMVAILKNDITIVSGTGTYDDPFIIEPTPKVNNTYSTNISDVVESVYMGYAPNNYLWYSGKLWRIIKKNSDNSVKLITEDSIILSTNIGTWTDENNEIKSFLNTTFRNSLRNYTNFLTINSTNGWCTNSFSYSGDWWTAYYRVMQNYSCTTRDNENYVGIPDLSDMLGSANHSRDDSDVMSYLDNSRGYWTMTQLLQNSKLRTYYVTSGNSNYESTTDTTTYAGIRPVVNIKPTIKVIKGNGSKNNPYRLSGDNDSNTTKKLTTRYSGEYVKYSGYLWRIVNNSTSGTQLVMSKYLNSISNSKYKEANYIDIYEPYISSNNIITTLNDSSYGFLSTLKNYDTILDNKSWKWIEGDCTKLSLSNVSGTSFTNYVGMLKYGDLFSGFETDNVYNSYYLLNRIYNNSNNDTICTIKYDNSKITPVKGYETISVRPSIYIKSNVYTKSGTGTLDEPFIIGE